jgi:hypothetical protein
MNDLHKSCLLIVPRSFYTYSEDLKMALLSLGYDVTVCNHEYPDSMVGKIMGKLQISLLLSITNKVITTKFLKNIKYDVVLIIKGRGISIPLIQKLKSISPKVIGYSFDSFEYHSAPLKWLKHVSNYYTFDYRDAERYNLSIIELFSSMPENPLPKSYEYEVSAIMRNHSDRLNYINKVFSNIPTENKFIYIFEHNIFSFIQNFIKNPFLYIKYLKYISFKSLPYQEYADVIHKSNFTIDFAHPTQSGITIRCFEALSSQTKIITNNPFVFRYKHFDRTNTIIYTDSSDPTVLKDQYIEIQKYVPVKHSRTIKDFINDLID